MPVKILFCYAHEDETLLNKLKRNLKPFQRQGLIEFWHDRDISAGTEWEQEISEQLNTAQIILLLVSPDFMASDYCYGTEMKRALERHKRQEARVIPVILRKVHWQDILGNIQALPTDAKPIMSSDWHSPDDAFFDVAEGIRKVVGEISNQSMSGVLQPSQLSRETQSDRPIQRDDEQGRNSDLQTVKYQFHEQRKRMLQILYEERSSVPYTLDREALAYRIGKPWYEIQPDVTYLENKGYLVTESSKIKSRTLHIVSITPEGIEFVESDFVESGMHPPFRKIDVFISSPGDVYEERQIVKRVLERCNRLPYNAEHYFLRPLTYEESVPAEVGRRPQTIVDRDMMRAGSSDLFICMLWHRMGTPVTHEETGERFQSGTEYEFLDAYRNNQIHEKPYILLYRGMKPFPPETDPEQLKAVEAFFKRFEGEHAEFKGLYKTYRSNEEFDEELFQDINTALSKNLIL